MKKLFAAITVVVMCLVMSVTALAAPYYNYSFHKGFVTAEPQAYVPYKVIDSVSMGLYNGESGIALNKPEDMADSALYGDIAIADTGNNRVVIIDKKYKLVQIINEEKIKTSTVPVIDPETGEQKVDENGNKVYENIIVDESGFEYNGERHKLSAPEGVTFDIYGNLYVCDTGNSRIVRFVRGENGKYTCDYIFEMPKGLNELLSSEGDGNSVIVPEESTTPGAVTEAPSEEVTEAPTEEITEEATAEEAIEATPAPTEEITEEATDAPTEAPSQEATQAPTTNNASNQYKPIKIAITSSGTMYVVSKGNHKGLIELSSDGSFTKFTGATKVKQTLSSLLNRLLTDEQKSKTTLNLSTEYSNICLDADEMIYGTINSIEGADLYNHFRSASEIGAAVKRISPTGDDILKRNDVYPPSGDLGYDTTRENYSAMVDVAVADDGIYSVLDSNKGRIFTYNVEGELLFVFGAKGSVEGSFSQPVAIGLLEFAAIEDGIVTEGDLEAENYKQMIIAVFDRSTAQITLFKPTEYGKLIRRATMCQQNRDYDEAIVLWNEVLDQASNSRLAFNGLGRIQYVRGDYEDACENFMKAYNQGEYAEAFAKLRNQKLEDVMPYIMSAIVVIVVAFLIKSIVTKIRRFIKTGGKADE